MDPQIEKVEQQQETQELNNGAMYNKNLVFRQYPSIELSTRDKIIKAIREHEFDKENILWVASEKIHGSNFSIHCTGEKVRYGRRTDFLSDQIQIKCQEPGKYFKQTFFSSRILVKTFHNNLQNVYKNLKALYPDIAKFAIYGEYFGGLYPDQKVKQLSQVQKGVCYTPNHEFFAFDIRVETDKTSFWVDVEDIPKILQDNIKSVPIYARGTFDQMLNIDSKIDSTIPELLGLPKVQKNIIEGFVIRPNHNLKYKNNERVMLKKKNAEFQEVARAPNPKIQKQKKQIPLDPEIQPYVEALSAYLNFNRIQSTISKFPDLKDRNKLKGEILTDILKDAAKDEYKEPEAELNKKVRVEIEKKIMKMMNEYFIKH